MTALLASIGFFIHNNLMGLAVLVGLVLVDQFTGVWSSLKDKTFDSFEFRNGLIKLLFYIIIIGSFHSLNYLSPTIFEFLKLDSGALIWLSATEVISIVENSCSLLNLPFPSWILDKLKLFTSVDIKNKNKSK